MTAASTSRRERRRKRSGPRAGEMAVYLDKPPLFVDLRPMTIADLEPGETWTPGMTIVETSRCGADGRRMPPKSMRLPLPPELRANTFENVTEIFRRFRRMSPELKEIIDSHTLFFPKAAWATGPFDPTATHIAPG